MSDYDLIQWLRDKVAKRGKNEKMYRQLLEMATGDESEPPEPELKPCPFCGSDRALFIEKYDAHCVECLRCSATGSLCTEKQEAVNTWNRTGQECECKEQ